MFVLLDFFVIGNFICLLPLFIDVCPSSDKCVYVFVNTTNDSGQKGVSTHGRFIITERLESNKMAIDRKISLIGLAAIVVLILGGILHIVALASPYWHTTSALLFNGKMLRVGNSGLWVECIATTGVTTCGSPVIADEGKTTWGEPTTFVNTREIIYLRISENYLKICS